MNDAGSGFPLRVEWLVDLPDKINRQVDSRVVAREIGLECYN